MAGRPDGRDDDGWVESTEGDLDPDLSEEAGYSGWDPPTHRAWMPVVVKVVAAALLFALVASVVLPVLR